MIAPTDTLQLRRARLLGAALATAAGVLLVMSVFVSIQVAVNLRQLNTANSDNIHWTLTQAEVELLQLADAIDAAVAASDPDLETLRRNYDILYSRIQTLRQSPFYRQVGERPDFSSALSTTQRFLDDTVPLMDGDNRALQDALPELRDGLDALHPEIRQLAVTGLGFFTEQSDQRREGIAGTLRQLAALAILLLTALLGLIVFMLSLNRHARNRGRALARTNRRMNAILSTSLDAVIVADLHGHVLEFSAAAETVFGITAQELRGRPLIDLLVPEQYRAGLRQGLADLRAGREPHLAGRGRVRTEALRADGQLFPVEISIEIAHDGEQEIIVIFLRDISHQVASERELREAHDQALAGEKAKAEFLNVMSHEIRTPLNGLLGNLSLLDDTRLNPDQAHFVRNMEISGRVLMRHVDSVLDIARFESGHTALDLAPVDLSALVRDAIASLSGLAERQGTTIAWRWIGPPAPRALSDGAALQQVLLNLLGNAIKFTPGGTVTIEIEADPDTPGATASRTYELRVIDTGAGIPETELDRVFQDFVTRDASFRRETGGTGLGLGISRRIVHALRGEIGVESTLGEGSVFWVRLPLLPDTGTGIAAAPRQIPAEPALPHRILLVEDNRINRDVVSEMLRREGHEAHCAHDGASGVQMAEARRYDLILMDISMPVMDGLEAARRIRTGTGASRDTAIIAFSANVLPQDSERFLHAGMDGFLSKPLTRADLRNLIERVSRGAPLSGADLSRPGGREPDPFLDTGQIGTLRDNLGDPAFDGLLARFQSETETLVAALSNGAATRLSSDLADRCHQVAGSAAVFGATGLRATLLRLETAARARDGAAARAEIAALDSLWQATAQALDRLDL